MAAPSASRSPTSGRSRPARRARTRLTLPDAALLPERSRDLILRPDRAEPVVGNIQGQDLAMYDLTPQQYDSLIKLVAALCKTFPKIRCDYPRGPDGKLLPRKLDDDAYDNYQGILGHYHVQRNKVDPGPAFQWDRVIEGARKLISE
jgi:N-acetylmuramoyl-L-alanine amidase